MNLLKKLKERKEDKKLHKDEILVYINDLESLELREEKEYFIVGCYNDDRSQFTNLATGETFNLNTTYGNTMTLRVKDRNYLLMSNYGYYYFEDDEKILLKANAFGKAKEGLLTNNLVIDYKNVRSASYKQLKAFYKFLMQTPKEEVTSQEIKAIDKALNNYAYNLIAKELEKSQSL